MPNNMSSDINGRREEKGSRSDTENTEPRGPHTSEDDRDKGEISRLEQEIKKQKAEIEQTHKDKNALRISLSEQIDDLVRQCSANQRQMQDRFREIAGLTRLVQERDKKATEQHAQIEWLRRVIMVLTIGYGKSLKARLAGLLPTFITDKRRIALLKRKGLFDANTYIAFNPDVASEKLDPLRHYVNHGIHEDRVSGTGA